METSQQISARQNILIGNLTAFGVVYFMWFALTLISELDNSMQVSLSNVTPGSAQAGAGTLANTFSAAIGLPALVLIVALIAVAIVLLQVTVMRYMAVSKELF